ncbi:hypothetical protein CDAR_545931 [Caerostris darwini]|uniref:Uncharacterized protein n=1 Tax=Caerostris darwini TaxID=1538125 RepID=A0AAV4X4Y2_9ARAC|nr:hypothetical protein CDAR_545931 [Caerostris darwini]
MAEPRVLNCCFGLDASVLRKRGNGKTIYEKRLSLRQDLRSVNDICGRVKVTCRGSRTKGHCEILTMAELGFSVFSTNCRKWAEEESTYNEF